MKKTWMSWSSGKDSAFALYELQKQPDVKVVGLLTTVNDAYERVVMHAVHESLLVRQAEELDLPLYTVQISPGCSNERYAERMYEAIGLAIKKEVSHIAFGDLFLEDVKKISRYFIRVDFNPPFISNLETTDSPFSATDD